MEAVESVQSSDAERLVTTASVATIVLPVKKTAKEIEVGSANGETGSAKYILIPMPRSERKHNS